MRGLPADASPGELMSHSALRTTIVRILDMRTADLAAARDPEVAIESDSVFDSIAAYYRRQYAGDGDEVQVRRITREAYACDGSRDAGPGIACSVASPPALLQCTLGDGAAQCVQMHASCGTAVFSKRLGIAP